MRQRTSQSNTRSARLLPQVLQEQGRRVRWERDPNDPELIIIRDAATGEVIAVVRSLFDAWAD